MAKKSRNERTEELYKIYRDYIEHEDGLINSRTTTLITIQSFILGTFGLTYHKKFEVISNFYIKAAEYKLENKITTEAVALPDHFVNLIDKYNMFMLFFPVLGMASSYFAYRSVQAALKAMRALEEQWHERIIKENKGRNLPSLTGGGSDEAAVIGACLVQAVPKFFGMLWAIVFILLLLNDIFNCEISTKSILDLLRDPLSIWANFCKQG